jgi:hypothetical protein
MTTKQRIAILADWWPRACSVQHWRRDDRPKRLSVISEAVGRQIGSLNELDNAADIDKVKAHLGALAEELDSAIELTPAGEDYGYRRRLLWLIRKHGMALSPSAPESYVFALAHDKFHLTHGLSVLEDLTTDQLHQLMITLNARRHTKLKELSNQSYTSEETFPDQVAFDPETEAQLVNEPF